MPLILQGEHWALREVTHFLDHTARKPKVRLETMAEMKPVQLKVRSDADASATPACIMIADHGPEPDATRALRDACKCDRAAGTEAQ